MTMLHLACASLAATLGSTGERTDLPDGATADDIQSAAIGSSESKILRRIRNLDHTERPAFAIEHFDPRGAGHVGSALCIDRKTIGAARRAAVSLFEARELCEVTPFRDRAVLANVVRQHVFSIGVRDIQRL